MSTDSTDYSGSRSYKRRSGGGGWERTSRKVENLAHSLKDTNRNLKAVDKMLLDYKDASEQQNSVIDKLQGDVSRSRHRIRDEKARIRGSSLRGCSEEDLSRDSRRRSRMPTSPLRNYDRAASDHEFADDWQPTRNSVRFYDDMDTPPRLHRLHQSVRDVSSEQLRLEDDLQQEILRRHRIETDHNKTLAALLEQTKQADPALNSVEQRLQSIQDELRSERTFLRRKQDEVGKVSQELKQQPANVVYDGRVNAVENEAQLRARLTQVETQKTAMESELERTKQRLEQVDGNKSTLITEVNDMRRQLSRVEHERDQLGLQLEQRERDLKAQLKTRSLDEQQDGLREQEIKRLKQDLEEARSQLTKSASVVGDYGELRRELDKSERLRSQLSDHIQVGVALF
ncbi:hypothetical protein CAPTEDRAFT_175473 [Capitella teleta]|uniref:Uncharacterized protein n=1 Tax=Capitella teleta TaxID=283909 RepID=R7V1Z6_CAPTE|nr:hypothetical protein CAPTEDRAFT_175473 [Capitella teleta]|eukprot:ELU12564.1 hypothetical protein CAPTEDRAFT_175473 [Capitella teleta]